MSGTLAELSVSLWRGAKTGRYETYMVPRRESQTVLDVVTFVQRHIDPTLSYRFACRVGVCGSCAMTVNGKPRCTCRTHVAKVAGGGRLLCGKDRAWRRVNVQVPEGAAGGRHLDRVQRARPGFPSCKPHP